jgi:hypothetical protein
VRALHVFIGGIPTTEIEHHDSFGNNMLVLSGLLPTFGFVDNLDTYGLNPFTAKLK